MTKVRFSSRARNWIVGGVALVVFVLIFSPFYDPKAQDDACRSLKRVEQAALIYRLDTGEFPTSLAELVEPSGMPSWKGPYLFAAELTSADGRPLRYELESNSEALFQVWYESGCRLVRTNTKTIIERG